MKSTVAGSGVNAVEGARHQRRIVDMHDAARRGDVGSIKGLLEYGHKYSNAKDVNGVALLHRAAAGGHLEICGMLLEASADINVVDHFDETPLKKAVFSNQLRACQLLLQKKANINFADKRAKTPLHYAAEKGLNEVLKMLIDFGAKLDVIMEDLQTPMHLACTQGNLESVRILVNAKAAIDLLGGPRRSTPLHLASENGHVETAEFLLAEGADPEIQDDHNRTAVQLAKGKEMRDTLDRAFTKSKVDAKSCTAFGPPLDAPIVAADTGQVMIQPIDHNGEKVFDFGGWLGFAVRIELDTNTTPTDLAEEEGEACFVKPDKLNGIHICNISPRRVGVYLLHIVLFGIPIRGSPYKLTVIPSIPHPSTTLFSGNGIDRVVVGEIGDVKIKTKDIFGNWVATENLTVFVNENLPPNDFSVEFSPATCDIHFRYRAAYRACLISLTVTTTISSPSSALYPLHLGKSPYAVSIDSGPACGAESVAYGDGLLAGGVDVAANFYVSVKDRHKNIVASGGHKIEIAIISPPTPTFGNISRPGPPPTEGEHEGSAHGDSENICQPSGPMKKGNINPQVTDNGNGIFSVKFISQTPGRHEIDIHVNGERVPGSPFFPFVDAFPEWSPVVVASWMTELGFPEYTKFFFQNKTEGFMLPAVTADELETVYGVSRAGHRHVIIRDIQRRYLADVNFNLILNIDSALLVKLGVVDDAVRKRICRVVENFVVRLKNARKRDRDVRKLMKIRLADICQELTEKVEEAVRSVVAKTSHKIIEKTHSDEVLVSEIMSSLSKSFNDKVSQDLYRLCNRLTAGNVEDGEEEVTSSESEEESFLSSSK